jgi:phosphoribosylformylglycinamidine synthase
MPIAHRDGNYFIDAGGLERLEGEGQVVFRYVDESGAVKPEGNPNGSLHNIAGICNARRNVLGLMPHPERVSEALLGSDEGKILFASLLS